MRADKKKSALQKRKEEGFQVSQPKEEREDKT